MQRPWANLYLTQERNIEKGSFICEMDNSITQLKREGLIDVLRQRDMIVQEEESVEVYDSREIGFLFRVHPNYCAREKIIEEFQD